MAKLDHLGVHVADRRRAAEWYLDTLGLEVEFVLTEAGVTAVRDEADFTIFLNESPAAPARSTDYTTRRGAVRALGVSPVLIVVLGSKSRIVVSVSAHGWWKRRLGTT
jgi:catechol 2,3-dioxygenase-like lactoylglutathione lyase family enzyme